MHVGSTARVDRRIRHAIETGRCRSGHRLAVVELARCVNLSPSRFVHLSRRPTGHKPARSLRELRLDRARTLAVDSVLSIKEIMARAGFNDPSHFARDFRRTNGISPHMVAARASGTSGTRHGARQSTAETVHVSL
jgi:transcriptional regulator GlxA family with amidase domain